MKGKTSLTLFEKVLAEVDSLLAASGDRSAFMEEAIREYLQRSRRKDRDERDLNILNQHADELNEEALDVLSYLVEM